MSRVPTDPDDDDIKDILESMWDLTSRDERGGGYFLDSVDRNVETQGNGLSEPSSHFRLIDALDGLRTPATSEILSPRHERSPTTSGPSQEDQGILVSPDMMSEPQHQLSSLNPTGDGRFPAATEQAMPINSGPSSRNQSDQLNGNGHDVLNGNHRNINSLNPIDTGRDDGSRATTNPTMSAGNPSSGGRSTQSGLDSQSSPGSSGSHVQHKGTGEVKRVMASFFDNRMNHMGDEKAPATKRKVNPAPKPAPSVVQPVQTQPLVQQPIAAVQPVQSLPVPVTPEPMRHAPPSSVAHDSAAELMRPVLRQWLGENMPKIVESALQIEAAQTMNQEDMKKSDK